MTGNGALIVLMGFLFLFLGYMGVPVAFALIASVLVVTMFTPISAASMIAQLFNGMDVEALLAVLELKGTDTQAFSDAVEELSNLVTHHIAEEELTILAPARTEVGERVRRDLGEKWAARRNELIDQNCGSISNVRRIVEKAKRSGVLEE